MFARTGPQARNATAREMIFPAPTLGWVTSEPLAAQRVGSAVVMENWFPTTSGARVRKGATKHATLPAAVVSAFAYETASASVMFAATDAAVYDVTSPLSATAAPAASIGGLSSGYFSTQQIATAGGEYMFVVNGTDKALMFDGADWFYLDSSAAQTLDYAGASAPAPFVAGDTITGVTSGATATVDGVIVYPDNTAGRLELTGISGTFVSGETIGNGTDTATAGGTVLAAPASITGVSTGALSQVWLFASRLFFVETDSLSAWYLPVDSIGGAASEFSLRAVFQKGGKLLFGATWSMDSGDGMDDRCVFVSDAGEVAVYKGTDPSDSANWALEGRYDIPAPMGRNAFQRVGGDLLILTTEGVLPLSAVVQKDPAALSLSAVSRAIEDEWTDETGLRSALPWEFVKWDERNLGLVSLPTSDPDGANDARCFAVNLETGAWSLVTGWDARCWVRSGGKVYFGTNAGTLLEADAGGSDDGASYVARMALAFNDMGAPGQFKNMKLSRAIFLTETGLNPKLSASADYLTKWPTPPAAYDSTGAFTWGVSVWGGAVWGGVTQPRNVLRWQSVNASGLAISPQVQITQDDDVAPVIDLVSLAVTFEIGAVVY